MHTLSMCRDATSISVFLKRASISHKRGLGLTFWDMYNDTAEGVAWITTEGRFIGVGAETPNTRLARGEYLINVALPWDGCGRDVTRLIKSAKLRISRSGRSDHFATRNNNGKLVRTLALT